MGRFLPLKVSNIFLFMHQIQSSFIASSCKYLPPRSSLHDSRTKLMVVVIHKTTLKYLHSPLHLCSECQLPPFNSTAPFLKKNPCVSGLLQWVNNACVGISMLLVVHSILQWFMRHVSPIVH